MEIFVISRTNTPSGGFAAVVIRITESKLKMWEPPKVCIALWETIESKGKAKQPNFSRKSVNKNYKFLHGNMTCLKSYEFNLIKK